MQHIQKDISSGVEKEKEKGNECMGKNQKP